jgi:hypothetical protein
LLSIDEATGRDPIERAVDAGCDCVNSCVSAADADFGDEKSVLSSITGDRSEFSGEGKET